MRKDEIKPGDTLAVLDRPRHASVVAKVEVIGATTSKTRVYGHPLPATRVKVVKVTQASAYGWLPYKHANPTDVGNPGEGDEAIVLNRNLFEWGEEAEAVVERARKRAAREAGREALEEAFGVEVKLGRAPGMIELAEDDAAALAERLRVIA